MTPGPAEREGYVPNVLYSCGGLIRRDHRAALRAADATVGFAFIDLPGLLDRLRGNAVAQPRDEAVSQVVG